jgi:GNAT superfamily N-acetyltransferase
MNIEPVLAGELQAIRALVLGWPEQPVAGDNDPGTVHVAELDQSAGVVAAVSYVVHPCPARPDDIAVYLWGMAVLPQYQRRGLGTALIQHVLAEARLIEAAVVWADARESTVPFYESLGAVVEGPRVHDDITKLWDRMIIFDL